MQYFQEKGARMGFGEMPFLSADTNLAKLFEFINTIYWVKSVFVLDSILSRVKNSPNSAAWFPRDGRT
jgi:hypothetical protein